MAHLVSVEGDKLAGSYVTPTTVTFGAYVERWLTLQVQQSEGTRDQAERRLRLGPVAAFGDVPIRLVTRAMVQDLVVAETERTSPATARLTFTYTRAVFNAAVRDRLIAVSPCTRINLPRVVVSEWIPSVGDVQTLVGRLEDSRWRPWGRFRAAVLVAAGSGLRPGELRSLTVDRVTPAGLVVDRQLTRGSAGRRVEWGPLKTSASVRTVPLAASTRAALEGHLEDYPRGPEGLVFAGGRGGVWTRQGAGEVWARVTEGLGFPDRSGWHALRHHHASLLIAAGSSPRAVADRLGHEDPAETLRTYSKLWPSDQALMLAAVEAAYGE
ncbi:site-specific integrase [Yimella sp. cx-573]|nr:site-specific integrase [Yimella sp. cx-573]